MKNTAKKIITCAAFLFCFANAASAEISMNTFAKYQSDIRGCRAEILMPHVCGLSNKDEEDALNKELAAFSLDAAKDYQNKALGMLKYGTASSDCSVKISYSVKADNKWCTAFDVCRTDKMPVASEKHKIYTFCKSTASELKLKDLFNEKADYIKIISEYAVNKMRSVNEENGKAIFLLAQDGVSDGFSAIHHDQNFYLSPKGNIVICFDKYEAAVGAAGCTEIEIPIGEIKVWLKGNMK